MFKYLKKLLSKRSFGEPEFNVRPRVTPEELINMRRQQAARDAAWMRAWRKAQNENLSRIARHCDAEGGAE